MHFVSGRNNGNYPQARRLYVELYPGRRVTRHKLFVRLTNFFATMVHLRNNRLNTSDVENTKCATRGNN